MCITVLIIIAVFTSLYDTPVTSVTACSKWKLSVVYLPVSTGIVCGEDQVNYKFPYCPC